ncbi:MAG: hypothetical protein J6Z01_17065 [Bacteroidales bacterium]|nr:hypothetical protein [Bacteroidales bacterium]
MGELTIADNCRGIKFSELDGSDKGDFDNLRNIANRSIETLVNENPHLLIFPHSLHYNPDKIEEDCILRMSGGVDNAEISTGNIAGFIGYKDTQLTINSRFQTGEQDYFLQYMVQKVFLPNVFDLPHTTNTENVFDVLPLMFPYYLNKSLKQGVFKTYQKFERNDSRVKGVINVDRHIKLNIPFMGKIAYTSRECSYDNPMIQLIRHTIEYIKSKKYGKSILTGSSDIQSAVRQIIEVTHSYAVQQRQSVINKNLKPVNHPYYSEYRPLQKLCMAILNHKKLSYGRGANKVYGLLFDCAWLWEEYLATILKSQGFTHPLNRLNKGAIYVDKEYKYPRYPDYYKRNQNPDDNCIIDAKYKRMEIKKHLDRDDLNQLITYLHILPSKKAYLVYPFGKDEVEEKQIDLIRGEEIKIQGFKISQKTQYEDFCDGMVDSEQALIKNIK